MPEIFASLSPELVAVSLPTWVDLASVVVGSATGIAVARKRHLDAVGFVGLALLCGLGGGLIRDIMMQRGGVYMLDSAFAIPASVATGLVAFLFPQPLDRAGKLLEWLDITAVAFDRQEVACAKGLASGCLQFALIPHGESADNGVLKRGKKANFVIHERSDKVTSISFGECHSRVFCAVAYSDGAFCIYENRGGCWRHILTQSCEPGQKVVSVSWGEDERLAAAYSDHVTIMDDMTQELFSEIVRAGALDRVHYGLDYFDASINRIGAYVIGSRAAQKCMTRALLEPLAKLREYEANGQFFQRLALLEEAKSLPWNAVWDMFCLKNNVPVGETFIPEIEKYEAEVTSKR